MKQWQLQEAKAKLSEVIHNAAQGEPQEITLRGEPTVVILSIQDYLTLKQPKQSFIDFIQQSALYDTDIALNRDDSLTRNVNL